MTNERGAAAKPRAELHDLGYKRYEGERRVGQAWRIIARRGLRTALKQWLTLLLLVSATAPLIGGATFLYAKLGSALQTVIPITVGGILVTVDSFEVAIGFFVAVAVGTAVFTSDFRTGAFSFYFSRPVTPVDYLVGKLFPVFTIVGCVVLLPQLILAIETVAITGDPRLLVLIAKALVHGTLATLALSAPAALISTVVKKRALGAVWFFALFVGSTVLGEVLASAVGEPDLRTIGIAHDIFILGQVIYREQTNTSPLLAGVVLLLVGSGSLLLAWRRLGRKDIFD